MKKILRKMAEFGSWLEEKYGEPRIVPMDPNLHWVAVPAELVAVAIAITGEVEGNAENASSENKFARAYSRMKRRFPDARGRDLGMAIELALR